MNRKTFTSLLAKRLYPMLRAEGFRGSGATLRRVAEPVVNVFNVQGSSDGMRCYLNLGAHLTFLPAEGGSLVSASEMKEMHCAFRSRIDPPADQKFGWSYGSDQTEAEANVERVVREWKHQAQPFFTLYAYPTGVAKQVEELQPLGLHPRHSLTYARVAVQLGQHERAMLFARAALEQVSSAATGLRYEIVQFIEGANAA